VGLVPAALHDRRIVFALAAALYGAVFAAYVLVEQPELGVAHFFYVPVCMVALAGNGIWGTFGGALATALYVLAVVVSPNLPTGHVLTTSTPVRFVTYCGVGAIVGWYANRNRSLVAELRRHALTDALTGIGNAHMFDEELARRCAGERPFTLVLADVDDFGSINETHGHDAGDDALRAVAGALRGIVGRTDIVARIGGDEFALLTERPPEQAALVCRRISRTVASEGVHLSFGTTASPDDGTTAVELFRKADDRLFAAKLVSRNRRTVVALNRLS
jgi:diguanylate cyclase (GGDEF)-like protein